MAGLGRQDIRPPSWGSERLLGARGEEEVPRFLELTWHPGAGDPTLALCYVGTE